MEGRKKRGREGKRKGEKERQRERTGEKLVRISRASNRDHIRVGKEAMF